MAIVGVPDRDADLLYAAGYACPDPLAWFQARGKSFLIVNDLELADKAPRRLWDAALYELHKRLMGVVDGLNLKFGRDTVRCGLFPNSGAWRTRFERRSPAYTTDWRQLMTAY